MRMEIKKLRGIEIPTFKKMLGKYRGYDVIDLLIHKTLKSLGISREEFEAREKLIIKEEAYTKENTPPEEIRFCSNESCELPIFYD